MVESISEEKTPELNFRKGVDGSNLILVESELYSMHRKNVCF